MADGAAPRLRTPPPWKDDNPVCTLSTRPEVKHDFDGGLREFLACDERLLALVNLDIAPGRMVIEAPPDKRSPGRKAADRGGNAAILLIGGGNSPSLNKMLGVESVSGRAGSWAYHLLQPGREGRSSYLLVTDRRFTQCRASGKDRRYQALLDIPREAIADVRLIPKPMVRGRVVLLFTDRSLIALKYGTWRSSVARRMVDAVNQWRMNAAG